MIVDHKAIELFGQQLFERIHVEGEFRSSYGMSDEACFFHILRGNIHAIGSNDSLTVEHNNSILLRCGNYIAHAMAKPSEKNFKAVAVHFHAKTLRTIYESDLPEFLLNASDDTESMVKVGASELVNKYINDILYYFDHPQLITDEILVLKVKEIILLLVQTDEAENIKKIFRNLFSHRATSFQQVIESNILNELTLSELAQLAGLSLSAFKREFANQYEATPAKYLQGRRLEQAERLFKITNDSVSEVAYACCFTTISHFSRTFKSKYGVSPSEFKLSLLDK